MEKVEKGNIMAVKERKVEGLQATITAWSKAPTLLSPPRNKREFNLLVKALNDLVDIVGEDEGHPLARLMDTLGTLIHAYEEEHLDIPDGDPVGALSFLMKEHGLKQKDLSKELGTQGHVSQILNRKRRLTIEQIHAIADRFSVSPAVFI